MRGATEPATHARGHRTRRRDDKHAECDLGTRALLQQAARRLDGVATSDTLQPHADTRAGHDAKHDDAHEAREHAPGDGCERKHTHRDDAEREKDDAERTGGEGGGHDESTDGARYSGRRGTNTHAWDYEDGFGVQCTAKVHTLPIDPPASGAGGGSSNVLHGKHLLSRREADAIVARAQDLMDEALADPAAHRASVRAREPGHRWVRIVRDRVARFCDVPSSAVEEIRLVRMLHRPAPAPAPDGDGDGDSSLPPKTDTVVNAPYGDRHRHMDDDARRRRSHTRTHSAHLHRNGAPRRHCRDELVLFDAVRSIWGGPAPKRRWAVVWLDGLRRADKGVTALARVGMQFRPRRGWGIAWWADDDVGYRERWPAKTLAKHLLQVAIAQK